MKLDPPTIVALTGLLALIVGIFTTRRGQRQDARQTEGAQRLADRDQQWRESREITSDLRTDLDRARAEIDRLRADNARKDQRAERFEIFQQQYVLTIRTMLPLLHSEIAQEAGAEFLGHFAEGFEEPGG